MLDSGSAMVVDLSVTGTPLGVSAFFTPQVGTAGFDSTLVLNASASTEPGNYQVEVVGKSGNLMSSVTFQLIVGAAPPVSYAVSILAPSGGGTTLPPPGNYNYTSGEFLTVDAVPSQGWTLAHWLVNGVQTGNGTELSFAVTGDLEITPVFSQKPAAATTTPTASVSFLSSDVSASQIAVDGAEYSLPVSFDWPIGSNHTASAPSVVSVDNSTRLALVGWRGEPQSTASSLSITVKNNTTITAEYRVEYLVTIAFVSQGGGSLTPQNAAISDSQESISIPSGNSSLWLDAGTSYSFESATQDNVAVYPLNSGWSFTVTRPETVTIALSVYPVTVRLVDVFGQPISGASVTLATNGGVALTQVTNNTGQATFENVPMGRFGADYKYLGVSGSLSGQTEAANNVTVTVALSYPVAVVAVVFVAGLATAGLRARLRRSKPSPGYDFD